MNLFLLGLLSFLEAVEWIGLFWKQNWSGQDACPLGTGQGSYVQPLTLTGFHIVREREEKKAKRVQDFHGLFCIIVDTQAFNYNTWDEVRVPVVTVSSGGGSGIEFTRGGCWDNSLLLPRKRRHAGQSQARSQMSGLPRPGTGGK